MSMKNIKWLLGAFSMLLAMTTFTACSDDDDKLEVPVFPESVVLNCQPGENESIDITYNYAHLFPSKQTEMADKLDMERGEI